LRDQSFIAGEINRLLDTHIRVKEDNYLWDGTGTTPVPKGAYVYASAFASAAYTGFKPAAATIYDLIAIMAVEISNGYGGMYQPNNVVLNPADVLRMQLAKDSTGQYVIPPFTLNNGMVVAGMTVIPSESVTANTMLVGDFSFGTIYDDGGIEIEVGYVADNFKEDVVTIKARKRMLLLVRTAYTGAFLKSTDITTDVANITPGA
jgi:HK97 family phage major capsid protein